MYEFEISRWFVPDDTAIMPVHEVSTWRQHFTSTSTLDEDGNPVYEIVPIDLRARQLGPLCPPEVPPEEDWWFCIFMSDTRAIDVAALVGTEESVSYPPFESEYWTWITTAPRPGWTSVTEADYDTAYGNWLTEQEIMSNDSITATELALAQLLFDQQMAWDAKYAALTGDGISPATAELLLGPRPGGV